MHGNKGKKRTAESKKKMSLAKLGKPTWNKGVKTGQKVWNKGKKGLQIAWNKGKKYSIEEKIKLNLTGLQLGSKALKGKNRPDITGVKNNMWKGDDAKYVAKHMWIASKLGKPCTCEFCGRTNLKGRQIHWANKDHTYKRDLEDWIRLCVKCHSNYDKTLK
jgi:hypothetical protein